MSEDDVKAIAAVDVTALRKTFRGHRYVTLRIQDAMALLDTIERMERVLEWYADMENYDSHIVISPDNTDHCESVILSDLGTRARVALGKPRKSDLGA